jgi:uncharacterized Tic20 family protein
MAQAGNESMLSVALRGGGDLTIWFDRVVAAGQVYPLAELTGAALVGAPPVAPGMPPSPGVALRGHDGLWAPYIPADPPDAQRVLEAIYLRRPDLHATPGYPAAAPYGPPIGPSSGENVLAGIAHLSVFFAPILLPLIIWLASQRSAPYASYQAKQAFFFHLGIGVVSAMLAILLFIVGAGLAAAGAFAHSPSGLGVGLFAFLLAIPAVVAVALLGVGFSIYGAVEAFQGHPFAYPLLRGL